MNWFPLLTFAGGIVAVIGFEMIGPWFSKRWDSSFDSGQWCAIYWIILGTLIVCTLGHLVEPEDVPEWAPLIVVALLHVAVHLFGYLERERVYDNDSQHAGSPHLDKTNDLTKEASDDTR